MSAEMNLMFLLDAQALWVLVFWTIIGVVIFSSCVYFTEKLACPVMINDEIDPEFVTTTGIDEASSARRDQMNNGLWIHILGILFKSQRHSLYDLEMRYEVYSKKLERTAGVESIT